MKPVAISITVCIATKDRSSLLLKSLLEINSQALNARVRIPVIICDDASKSCEIDQSIIQTFTHLDVTILKNSTGKGLPATRNRLIRRVKTKFLIFLDDDDLWPPRFLSDFIMKNLRVENSKTDAIFGYNDPLLRFFGSFLLNSRKLVWDMYLPPVGCQIYKLETLKRYDIFYNEEIKTGVDHDMFFILAELNFNCKITYTKNLKALLPLSSPRITTNFAERATEIEKSICRWKMKSFVGESEFWLKLQKGYHLHIKYKKFRSYMKNRDFINMVRCCNVKIFRELCIDALYRAFGFRSGMKLRL